MFTQLIISFKNKPNRFIIVYHETDQTTIPFVNMLVEKGFENIFLLTGGIFEFIVRYHEYIEGTNIPMKVEKFNDTDSKMSIMRKPTVIQYRQKTPTEYMCETKNKICKHTHYSRSRI